jgi:hypothetical protein
VAHRAEKERASGRRPGGRAPTPPVPGPRAGDQYNFTDPTSRIMKNPTDQGFDQDYNAQIAVEQDSLLIVGTSLSNHPNDTHEAEPTLAAIPPEVGTPDAAALDHGYWGPATLAACASRAIEPYIATGREPHHQSWQGRFAPEPDPPPEDASAQVKMAYKLKTAVGQAIYRARKYTVEPVLGIITEVLGFRQFSLRGEVAAGGEWLLICLAFNLKRFHTLSGLQSQALPYLVLGLLVGGVAACILLARGHPRLLSTPDRAALTCGQRQGPPPRQRYPGHATIASFSPTDC